MFKGKRKGTVAHFLIIETQYDNILENRSFKYRIVVHLLFQTIVGYRMLKVLKYIPNWSYCFPFCMICLACRKKLLVFPFWFIIFSYKLIQSKIGIYSRVTIYGILVFSPENIFFQTADLGSPDLERLGLA